MTGCVARSPHSTTSRLLTIAAFRSLSNSTISRFDSRSERHLDHPHRALDDALTRGDDRAGLLALQHRLGDLRRVGQVADARLDDLDAGRREPFLNLLLHVLGDFGRVAAQRHVAFE